MLTRRHAARWVHRVWGVPLSNAHVRVRNGWVFYYNPTTSSAVRCILFGDDAALWHDVPFAISPFHSATTEGLIKRLHKWRKMQEK